MTTTTIYSDATLDDAIGNNGNPWPRIIGGHFSALQGSTSTTEIAGGAFFSPDYTYVQPVLAFDGSSVPDNEIVQDITVDIYGSSDHTTLDPILELYQLLGRSGAFAASEWKQPNDLRALPLVATYDCALGWSTSGYNRFTSLPALYSGFSVTGMNYYLLATNRMRLGTNPVINGTADVEEWLQIWMGDEGSTKRPRLTVTSIPAFVTGRTPLRRYSA